jgi:hypothetical protein
MSKVGQFPQPYKFFRVKFDLNYDRAACNENLVESRVSVLMGHAWNISSFNLSLSTFVNLMAILLRSPARAAHVSGTTRTIKIVSML